MEHKLCIRHIAGPYSLTRGGGQNYPPILQLRKLRLREFKKHGQGHTASRW